MRLEWNRFCQLKDTRIELTADSYQSSRFGFQDESEKVQITAATKAATLAARKREMLRPITESELFALIYL